MDDGFVWTGGKPANGWVGDPSAANEDLSKPTPPSLSTPPPPIRGATFVVQAWWLFSSKPTALSNFKILSGTIALIAGWIPFPISPILRTRSSVMTNVIKGHSRCTVVTTRTLSSQQLVLYDKKYDRTNHLTTTKFHLSSLDPGLMSIMKEEVEDDHMFHVIWLQLIKTMQSTFGSCPSWIQGHYYNTEINDTSIKWLYNNEVAECRLPPPSSYY